MILFLIEVYFGLKSPKQLPAKLAHCVRVEKTKAFFYNSENHSLRSNCEHAGLTKINYKSTQADVSREVFKHFKSKDEFEAEAEEGRLRFAEEQRRRDQHKKEQRILDQQHSEERRIRDQIFEEQIRLFRLEKGKRATGRPE